MPIRKISIDGHVQKQKQSKTITEYVNNDYRAYTHYVLETRALPSIWDGFKTGARKILHSAFKGNMKNGGEIKMLNLVGDVYNYTLYMHGDASLNGTIFTESAEFADNLHPLIITGQHGSLRDPKAVSAPRYLYVKLSKYSKLYKVDEDLLEYVFDEGQVLEPTHYLPIIPLCLTSRAEGMAPGYKFTSFSYHPIDLIDACKEVLNEGKITKTNIRPYVRGISQDKFKYDTEAKRWVNVGEWYADYKNDIFQIKDLPFNMGYNDIEKKLNAMVEKGTIRDWKTYSHDDIIDYRLIFPKNMLSKEFAVGKQDKLIKSLGLQSYTTKDILTVLDENKKIKLFDTKEDLIEYFVKLRLSKYTDRKTKMVSVLEDKLASNEELCKFIELVNNGTIVVSNRKTKDVKEDLKKHNISDRVLQIAISKLTDEEKNELLAKNAEMKKEIEYIKATSEKDMYINDLNTLRKELLNDFK